MDNDELDNISESYRENKETDASGLKMNPFLKVMTVHNTTIIAIIMSIVSMISSNISEKVSRYADTEQQAEADSIQLDNEIADLNFRIDQLKVSAEDTSSEYQEEDTLIDQEIARLSAKQAAIDSVRRENVKVLESAQSQETSVGYAKTLSEIAVLVSAVGLSNKKKILMYAASAVTVVCILLVLFALVI